MAWNLLFLSPLLLSLLSLVIVAAAVVAVIVVVVIAADAAAAAAADALFPANKIWLSECYQNVISMLRQG